MGGEASEFNDWLVALRRDIHRQPELAFEEHDTTARICRVLEQIGARVQTFPDITGVVGILEGAGAGPTIGLRADIDALPLQELNEVAYCSAREGVMHACGHDAHTAIMLGVARKIVDSGLLSTMRGRVKFIFQPAEEGVRGAQAMIERGVLEEPHVDRMIAGHVGPNLPVGMVGVARGQAYASADRFEVIITGAGTHGARPDEGADPIVAGAHFVTASQTIVSRNVKPTHAAVVTIGRFQAGQAANIIPQTAVLEGTVRALSPELRRKLLDRLKEIAAGVGAAFQVDCRFVLHQGVPPLVNDGKVAEDMIAAAGVVVGEKNVVEESPTMGAEDFGLFCADRPGAMIRLGCGNREKGLVHPLHSPRFDMDEGVLRVGVDVFYEAVRRFLR
jgi:amidohydrolase